MSRGPRHWLGRERRPNHAGAKHKQDVLVAAWRDDEGTLHAIPSLTMDLRHDDEERRWEEFSRFSEKIGEITKELACGIEVTRIENGVASLAGEFSARGILENDPGGGYPRSWHRVIARAYDWLGG